MANDPSSTTLNIVHSPFPSFTVPSVTFSEYLAKKISCDQIKDHVAIINATNDGSETTYGQLHNAIQRRALGLLKNCHLSKNDVGLIFSDNNVDYLLSMLALVYLGITYSPVAPTNGSYELAQQLMDTHASILIADRKKLSVVQRALNYNQANIQLKAIVVLDNGEDNIEPISNFKIYGLNEIDNQINDCQLERIPYFPINLDDHLIIVYTSGTTGKPKGAIHSQHSMLASLLQSLHHKTSSAKNNINRYLFWYPFGHISGSYAAFKNLLLNDCMVLESSNDLSRLLSSAEKYQVNQFPISPSHAFDLVDKTDYCDKLKQHLKVISFGGYKIPIKILERIKQMYNVELFEGYGSTEMMGIVLQQANSPPGSVGVLCPNTQMRVVHLESGHNLPANESGELCFRGPGKFIGYLGDAKATAEVIDQDGWYHTGDVGYYDDKGNLFLVDRIKELIKYKYFTIWPLEVEEFLQTHPAIHCSCVVGVPHPTDGNLIRAYVQLKNNQTKIEPEQIVQYVKDNFGFHKQLRGGVCLVDSFVRTTFGKIDRKYYRSLASNMTQ